MDAAHWVEYCNGPVGSYWADKRAEYGHPEPYGIKYWDLGNEVDGAPWIIAHKDAEDYVKFAVEAAKAMRRSSPGTDLHFVANGSSYYKDDMDWVEWNWKVIKALYGIADYVSIHRYWDTSDDYYVLVGQRAMDLDEKISVTANQIKAVSAVRKGKPMYVSLDEWAPPFMGGHLSTLAVAQYFNAFLRHADVLKMANFTALSGILGRDQTSGATYKSPTFYAFKLFSTRCRGAALDTFVESDTFRTSDYYTKIPYLDVTSVYDKDSNRVVINVVNRHRDEAIEAEIQSVAGSFTSAAQATLITSPDVDDKPYTYENRDAYPPKTETVPASGRTLRFEFPPHSFTQVVVNVER
jgi:alpha-N-arabinofuranosidase